MMDSYRQTHATVWPEVEQRLSSSGITNYTIFEQGDVLVSYYEYRGEDHAADILSLADHEPSLRWAALMQPHFQAEVGTDQPANWIPASEIWHLE